MTQTTLLKKAEEKKSPRGRSNGRVIAAAALVIFVALFSVVNTLAFLKSHTSPILNLFAPAMKYVLDYDANAPASENVTVPASQESWYTGKFTVSSDTPEREGYTFLGWKRDKNGAGSYVPGGSSYTADTKHTVLYAQWKENTHTYALVFHANGGENVLFGGEKKGAAYTEASAPVRLAEASHTFAAGTLAASAEREEYTFLGWAETATEETPAYKLNAGGRIAQAITVLCDDGAGCTDKTHEKHLYAVWIESGNIFKLHYHENAGSVAVTGMPDPSTEIFNDPAKRWHEFVVTGEEPVRADGLYFHSWNTEPDGGGESYSDGKVFYMEFEDDEETTVKEAHLYAQWRTPNSYKLTYDENAGGAAVTGMPDPLTREAKSAHRSYTFTLESGIPVRTDGEWIFAGWNTKADGSGTHHGAGAMFTETLEDGATSAEATLYAQWLAGNYVLIYDPNGGTGEPETAHAVDPASSHTFTIAAAPSIENGHLVFMGWADTPDATAPVYAYNKIDHTGKVNSDLAATLTLTEAERVKTIYAVWGFRYEISYDHNAAIGGTGPVPPTESYVTTEKSHTFMIPKQTAENTPTRPDYYWGWWGNSPTHYRPVGSHQYNEPITFYASEPVRTLYAFYQPPQACELMYDQNTTDTVTNMPVPGGIAASITEYVWKVQLTSQKPNRANYIFLGWSEDPKATKADYEPGAYYDLNKVIQNRRKLYAVWERPHAFHVIFDQGRNGSVSGGGTGVSWTINSSGNSTYTDVYGTNHSVYNCHGIGIQNLLRSVKSYTFTNITAYVNQTNYKFLGWSYTKGATTPDIPVDDKNKLTKDITVEVQNEASCGNTAHAHYVVLHPVFAPLHGFHVVFDRGYNGSVSGGGTGVSRTDYGSGSYNYNFTDVYGKKHTVNYYYTLGINNQPLSKKSYTFTNITAFVNQTNYKFLGWSYTKGATTPDFPVDDKNKFTKDITVEIQNEASCGNTPHGHYVVLYPVYAPLHGFYVVFDSGYNGSVSGGGTGVSRTDYGTGSYNYNFTDVYGKKHTVNYYYTLGINNQPLSKKSHTFTNITAFVTQTNHEFLGWSYTKGATTPDIPVDDKNKLTKDITVEIQNEASCGDTAHGHYVVLYPVYAPLHGFHVVFDSGYNGSVSGGGTGVSRTDYGTGSYNYTFTDVYGKTHTVNYYYTLGINNQPHTKKSHTFTNITAFVTQLNYEFLGWSYTKGATTPDIPVDAKNKLTKDITVAVQNSASCGSTTHSHYVVLYPVYVPQHGFHVIFDGAYNYGSVSGGGTGVSTSVYTSTNTVTDVNGKSHSVSSYRYLYINNQPLTKKSHTFTNITAYVTKTNYELLGWAYTKNATTPDIPVDDKNKLTKDITVAVQNSASCGNNAHIHYVVLYPVFAPLHAYELVFATNTTSPNEVSLSITSGYSSGYYSNATIKDTSGKSHTGVYARSIQLNNQSLSVKSHTFNNITAYATRTGYKFLGWSYTKNATSADITVSDKNVLSKAITVTDPKTHCTGLGDDTMHRVVLYAVWVQTYTLTYNANGGTGAPAQDVYLDYTAKTSHTFTLSTVTPTKQKFAFMGWATTNNALYGEYGYPTHVNKELDELTSGLKKNITATSTNRHLTVYAVWWYEYKFTYDANGGSEAPPHEHAYASTNRYNLEIDSQTPKRTGYKFLGWSTDKNDLKPKCSPYTDDGYPTVLSVTADSSGSTKITLYAVWEKTSGTNSLNAAPLAARSAPLALNAPAADPAETAKTLAPASLAPEAGVPGTETETTEREIPGTAPETPEQETPAEAVEPVPQEAPENAGNMVPEEVSENA